MFKVIPFIAIVVPAYTHTLIYRIIIDNEVPVEQTVHCDYVDFIKLIFIHLTRFD